MKDSMLLDHFQKATKLHVALAKAHHAVAAESEGATATFHKAAQEAHTSHAEHCLAMCKALSGATNADRIDDIVPGTERGGSDPGGPTSKAAFEPFGMAAALQKSPAEFGMSAARRGLDKVIPTRVHSVVPDAPRLVSRAGGRGIEAPADPTDTLDALLKR
jgi:hypothetical protein